MFHPSLSLDDVDSLDLLMGDPSILFADAPLTNDTIEQNHVFDLGDFETEFFDGMDRQNWSNWIDPVLLLPKSSREGFVDSTAPPPLINPSSQATHKMIEVVEPVKTSRLNERPSPSISQPVAEEER